MRWIGVALAVGVAVFALAKLDARMTGRHRTGAQEAISDASHARLERVLHDAGAGEAAKP
jgi:16S rRNA C1402 N4-methylase RsmH